MHSPEEAKAFLVAVQSAELSEVRRKLAADPSLLHARSTSKGYTAMHYAAMAGATPLVDLLHEQGLSVTVESPAGVTPLQVALEYKRLPTARHIQGLRDAAKGRQGAPPARAAPAAEAPRRPTAEEVAASFAPPEALAARRNAAARSRPPAVDPAPPPASQPPPAPPPASPPRAASAAPCAARGAAPGPASAPPRPQPPPQPLSPPKQQAAERSATHAKDPSQEPPQPPQPPQPAAAMAAPSPALNREAANREAAAQALAAGERALRGGNLPKAVRLLQKAKGLSGDDERVGAALAEATAMLRESEREKEREAADTAGSSGGAAAPGEGGNGGGRGGGWSGDRRGWSGDVDEGGGGGGGLARGAWRALVVLLSFAARLGAALGLVTLAHRRGGGECVHGVGSHV